MKRKALFMVAAVALLVAACSTETRVLPKKPVITDPLSLQSNQYPQGATAVPLTVTATTKDKKAKLSYQWYSNTENNNKKGTKIAGATDVDYTPSTEAIGEFYYYVEVVSTLNKEKARTTSDVAAITVVDPAEVPKVNTSNGKEGETETGEDILLSVKLPDSIEELLGSEDGDYEVLYQWYNNGTRNSNVGGTAIAGATEASYIPPTDVAGTIYYYAVVTVKDKVTDEVVKTMTTSPQKVTVIINTQIIDNTKVNARVPLIEEQPEASSKGYFVNITADPLTVKARVSDDGVLSYQWYRNTEDSTTGGERISGATKASYIPPTNEETTFYYYVVITNTIDDNQDGGLKTATRTSDTVKVQITKGKDAKDPVIVTPPQSQIYPLLSAQPSPISVTATSPDGGTLSYQWYRKLDEGNVGGDPIGGETSSIFTPPNTGKGIWYYFVEVSNTITDNGDGGNKTAKIRSDSVFIGIAITPLVITGITGKNKVYDGTTNAEWNGTPTLAIQQGGIGSISGVSLETGTARFADANAGDNIPITLIGWDLSGTYKADYKLFVPTDLKANITKAPGALIDAVTVNGTPTNNSLAVNAIVLENGQAVEYAVSKSASGTGLSAYQSGTEFTGLSAVTVYYVYARSMANHNYEAGTTPKVSAGILTKDPKVYFETYGGTVMNPLDITLGDTLQQSNILEPQKAGYLFDGWYTSAAYTALYDFGATGVITVTDNITIHARWISIEDILMMRQTYNMEWIPSTWAMLGNNAATRVMILGFWMAKHEVTQDEWFRIMLQRPSNFQAAVDGESSTPGSLPVEQINWYEALIYCNKRSIVEGLTPAYRMKKPAPSTEYSIYPDEWGDVPTSLYSCRIFYNSSGYVDIAVVGPDTLTQYWDANLQIVPNSNGYRLPTFEQWEKACRAGTTTLYSTGAAVSDNTGWYSANSGEKTHKVGQKPANQYGLYDMHGNVAEWCWGDMVNTNRNFGGNIRYNGSYLDYVGVNRVFSIAVQGAMGGCWFLNDTYMVSSTRLTLNLSGSAAYYPGTSMGRYTFDIVNVNTERGARDKNVGLRLMRPYVQ